MRQHREYADLLIHHGEIPGPKTRSEYYTPPVFYALAGAATYVGEHVHSGDPHKLGQVLNWFVLLATAVVLWFLARELFPRRPWRSSPRLRSSAFFRSSCGSARCSTPSRCRCSSARSRCCSPRDARPARVRLAARGRDGRRARRWPARARFLPLDARGGRARASPSARAWRPLARDRARRGGRDCSLVCPAGRQVRQPGLRPADEDTRRSGIAGPRGSTSASGCPTS